MTKQKLLGGILGAVAMDSGWEEGKHPRSKDGKFGSGGGSGGKKDEREPAPVTFHSSRDPKHVRERKALAASAREVAAGHVAKFSHHRDEQKKAEERGDHEAAARHKERAEHHFGQADYVHKQAREIEAAGAGDGQEALGPEPAKITGPVGGRGLKRVHEGAAESVRTGQSKEKFLANLKEQGYHEAHINAAASKHDELSKAAGNARTIAEGLHGKGHRRADLARHFFNEKVDENTQGKVIGHMMEMRAKGAHEDGHTRRQLQMNLADQGFTESEQRAAGEHYDRVAERAKKS